MVFAKKHLAEVTHSDPVNEATVASRQKLQSIRTYTKTMNRSVELSFEQLNRLGTISLKKHDLTISSANYNFVSSYGFNCFDPFRTGIYIESKHFVFDLKSQKVPTSCSSKQKIFSVFTVGQTRVLPYECSCVYGVTIGLTCLWIQLP